MLGFTINPFSNKPAGKNLAPLPPATGLIYSQTKMQCKIFYMYPGEGHFDLRGGRWVGEGDFVGAVLSPLAS